MRTLKMITDNKYSLVFTAVYLGAFYWIVINIIYIAEVAAYYLLRGLDALASLIYSIIY